MTPVGWLVTALAFGVGMVVGALLIRGRVKQAVVSRTLVPHRTRQVIGALQSGAIIVRRDRRAAFSNQPASALGIARPDGALHSDIADLAERAWSTGEVVEQEVEVRRVVLGVVTQVHVRVTPINEELALAVANDNTEQRAAEATRREFAVNVSHELKTPIGALSLLAENVEDASEEPELVRKLAVKMRREARRLTKLIQEIIEISRLQGGESVLDHEEVDVVGVVHEAFEGARLAAENRGVELVADVRIRPLVLGDRDLLVMAVRNLVDNAITFSDPGARVTASVTAKDETVSVAVLDQGIGIDAADQERIFERFYRTDPARARGTGGTGLGLSIVKHVALQHSGAVTVWSQPSVGSTFTMTLPGYVASA
jgi:two-component system sensor histidine kinase SenX3